MNIPLFLVLVACAVLTGCTQHQTIPPGHQTATILYRPAGSEAILACLNREHNLTRKALKAATQQTADQYKENPSEDNTQRLICLSLHPQAGYRQFNSGLKLLDQYISQHPENASGLQGLRHLLQRLNQERVARWQQNVKTTNTAEALDIENRELAERNNRLEQTIEQDQTRIQELRQQIEQLKNIETIIKNREQ